MQFSLLLAGKTSSLSSQQPGKEKISPGKSKSPQAGDPGGVTLIIAAFSKALAWHNHSLAAGGNHPPSRELESTFQSGAATNPERKGRCQPPQSSSNPRKASCEISPTTPKSHSSSVQVFPAPQSPNHSYFPFQQPHCNTLKPPDLLRQFLSSWHFLCHASIALCPTSPSFQDVFTKVGAPFCVHLPQNLNFPNNLRG